jgi:CRISPR-associated endonuclease/helicase Cas3
MPAFTNFKNAGKKWRYLATVFATLLSMEVQMTEIYQRNQYIHDMAWHYIQRPHGDSELGGKLGTSRSNVYKIRTKVMPELGYDVHNAGNGKYYMNSEDFVTHIPLNPQQSLALYLGARRLQQQTKSGQQQVATALEKLAKALRKPMAAEVVKASKVVLAQEQDGQQEKVLAEITESWLLGRKVRIKHRKLHGELRTYTVSPYLLEPAMWGDGIYLIGYSDYHNGIASFKVARIEHAFRSTEAYEMPASFNIQDLLQHTWGIWHADKTPEPVVLHFTRYVTPRIRESVWHPSQEIVFHDDGSCTWTAHIVEWREMEGWVRGWGANVEVVKPLEMRRNIERHILKMCDLYSLRQVTTPLNENDDDFDEKWADMFLASGE